MPQPLYESLLTHNPPTKTGWGLGQDMSLCGGHSVGETPSLSFPNLEAKPHNADGTAPGRVWESRKPPQTTPTNQCPSTHPQQQQGNTWRGTTTHPNNTQTRARRAKQSRARDKRAYANKQHVNTCPSRPHFSHHTPNNTQHAHASTHTNTNKTHKAKAIHGARKYANQHTNQKHTEINQTPHTTAHSPNMRDAQHPNQIPTQNSNTQNTNQTCTRCTR